MRILITGGSGFIGYPIVRLLVEEGHEVLALSRNLPEILNIEGVKWLKADLGIILSYQAAVKSFAPQIVIHLAWQGIPDFSLNISQSNLNQSIEILSFVISLGCCKKILISGSCFELNRLNGECFESEIGIAKDNFTWAKHSLYSWLAIECFKNKIELGWMRIFYVYGPRQRPAALIPTIFRYLQKGILPELITPLNSNDFIFVEDVADAFAKAVKQEIPSGIFNIGSGRSITVLEVSRIAEQIVLSSNLNSSNLENSALSSTGTVDFWANTRKSNLILDWSPKTDLFQGLRKTWNWLTIKESN
jgi:nucleoside-diphosphate-sugar epimerase